MRGGLWQPIGVLPVAALDEALLERPTEELQALARREGEPLRIAAACALAVRHDATGFDALVEGLRDPNLRYPCLEAMRHLGDPRALPHARKVRRRPFVSRFDRTQAAGVLAKLGEAEGVEHILRRLRRRFLDDDRGLACELAGELRMREAVGALEPIASDPRDLFRGAALKALMRIDPEAWEGPLLRIVRDEAEDEDVRCDCAEILHELGSAEARDLLAGLKTDSEELRSVLCELFDREV
ncbi:MAG: hypothetical protein D6729_01675 [Deltaproteobacteria bacterium]|nr:MAG: hypothetical protein D6729_01675 [Deltaproteobacteria bacterium]